jgi:hypothetical protein
MLLKKKEFKNLSLFPKADCFTGIDKYFKIGFSAMCIIWLEWCAFEFHTFISGYLDVDATGAQIILFNF